MNSEKTAPTVSDDFTSEFIIPISSFLHPLSGEMGAVRRPATAAPKTSTASFDPLGGEMGAVSSERDAANTNVANMTF